MNHPLNVWPWYFFYVSLVKYGRKRGDLLYIYMKYFRGLSSASSMVEGGRGDEQYVC